MVKNPRHRRLTAWALACGLGLAACAGDGRELREPRPDQTTTTGPSGDDGATAGGDVGTTPPTAEEAMRLWSRGIADGEEMPAEHTCRGEDISPALLWSNLPVGTVEIAVVLRDLDADGFVQWAVAGIPPDARGTPAGTLPEQAVESINDVGTLGWAGPCPDSGTHHYDLRVFALAEPMGLQPTLPGQQAAELIETAPALDAAALSPVVSGEPEEPATTGAVGG